MNLKIRFSAFVLVLLQITSSVGASNILGLFLTHSPSHVIIHMSIIRALVERGHNVTVITSIPLNVTNPACRYIFVKEQKPSTDMVQSMVDDTDNGSLFLRIMRFFDAIEKVSDNFADFALDPNFINFMKEDNKFDLMILGFVFNNYQLGVAAHFKCPVVLSFVVAPVGYLSRLIGNPTLPEFVPFSPFIDSKPMDFWGRVNNLFVCILEWIMTIKFDWKGSKIYEKYFPIDKYPSYSDIKENISLILANHHFSEGPIRPLVPGLVEIGGIQIKDKPDQLPEDIEEFLNNSPDGAIFFSLGSNVQSHYLSSKVFNIIFNVLSTLPYNVIWKNGQADGQQNASNILFKKWIPQDDILAHRNLKLFITHAGKGSTTESEYHGVPMVALPIMLDQFSNAESIVEKGHGVKLNYQTMTEESFRDAILNVMRNNKYRVAVQKFSRIYRDRPLTARENAVYWIEYVIRHKGAPHMQSPLKTMNIIQGSSVDVILFLVVTIYLVFKIVKLLGQIVIRAFKKLLKLRTIKNKTE